MKIIALLILFLFNSICFSQTDYKKIFPNTYEPLEQFGIENTNLDFKGYLVIQISKKNISNNEIIADIYLIKSISDLYTIDRKFFLNNNWLHYNILNDNYEYRKGIDSSFIFFYSFLKNYYETSDYKKNLLLSDFSSSFLEKNSGSFFRYKKKKNTGFYIFKIEVQTAVVSFIAKTHELSRKGKTKRINNFFPLNNFSVIEPLSKEEVAGFDFSISKWKPKLNKDKDTN